MRIYLFFIGFFLLIFWTNCGNNTSSPPREIRIYKSTYGNSNEKLFQVEQYNSNNKLIEVKEYSDSGKLQLHTTYEYLDTILKEKREYYSGNAQPDITLYDSIGRKKYFRGVCTLEKYFYTLDKEKNIEYEIYEYHNLCPAYLEFDTVTYTKSGLDLKGNELFKYSKNNLGRILDSISCYHIQRGDSLLDYENNELTRIRILDQNHLIKSDLSYPGNSTKETNTDFLYDEKGQKIQECVTRQEFQSIRYAPATTCTNISYDKNGRIIQEKIFNGKVNISSTGDISSPEIIYRYEYIY